MKLPHYLVIQSRWFKAVSKQMRPYLTHSFYSIWHFYSRKFLQNFVQDFQTSTQNQGGASVHVRCIVSDLKIALDYAHKVVNQ